MGMKNYLFLNYSFIVCNTFFLISSCNQKDNIIPHTPNTKTWSITLDNNLGKISIILPVRLDTFFKWTQYSDCGDACAKVDYRIQSSHFPIFKETGFSYKTPKDSIDQFSICHSKLSAPWPFSDSILVRNYKRALKSEQYDNSSGFLIDTLISNNGLLFAVVGYNGFDKKTSTILHFVGAATSIKGNIVEFYFEFRNKDDINLYKDFLKSAFESIKSINVTSVL